MAEYRTTDLSLAAALKTILKRTPTVRINGRLAEFIYPGDPTEAQQVAERYYSDTLTGNLRTFATDLRDLKSLIHQQRDEHAR